MKLNNAFCYFVDPRSNSTGLGKGWVKAKDLCQGDVLVLLDCSTVIVDSVCSTKLDEPITVYNFEVEDFHTYFVGNSGLLVHNDCLPDSLGGTAAWKSFDKNDSFHSFPSIVDNYATFYGVYNDCYEYRAYGFYNGYNGYFQWYVHNGVVVHRQFRAN